MTHIAEVQVMTVDFMDALRAVAPHADPEEISERHRVRLILGRTLVDVLATNGWSAAMASVQIEEDSRTEELGVDSGPVIVDLTPRQVKLVAAQFKIKKDEPGVLALRVLHNGDGLEVADVSGLFAGESIRFPAAGATDRFPDIVQMLARALANASGEASPKPLTADGGILALFQAASVTYGEPLTVEATGSPEGRAFLVSCGEHFLGMIGSSSQDDRSARQRDKARTAWLRRLVVDGDPVAEAKQQLASV